MFGFVKRLFARKRAIKLFVSAHTAYWDAVRRQDTRDMARFSKELRLAQEQRLRLGC